MRQVQRQVGSAIGARWTSFKVLLKAFCMPRPGSTVVQKSGTNASSRKLLSCCLLGF